MAEQPVKQIPTAYRYISWMLFVGSIMMGFYGIKFISLGLKYKYPQIDVIIAGCTFLILGLWLLSVAFFIVRVRTRYGKTITQEERKKNFENDALLWDRVAKIILILFSLISFLVGACFIGSSCSWLTFANKKVETKDISTVADVVDNVSVLFGNRQSPTINITLRNYPEFIFAIDEYAYKATNTYSFRKHLHRGDSVYVEILTDQYQKKLTGEKQLEFFYKTKGYNFINIYGIRDAQNTYLTF